MSLRDSPEWRLGQWGERNVRRKFEGEHWFVVPVNLIEHEGAPALTQKLRRFVLPDLQVAGGGEFRWVEVKTKTRTSPNQKFRHGGEETGLPARHWTDYLTVCAESGLPGYLAMLHTATHPGVLFLARFEWLAIDARYADDSGTVRSFGEPMMFLNVNRFDRLRSDANGPYSTNEKESLEPPPQITPKIIRPWETGPRPPKQEMMPW